MNQANDSPFVQSMRSWIALEKSQTHTSLICEVLKYDAAEQTVSVKPAVYQLGADAQLLEIPIIDRVPVIFPSGGNSILSFPIKKGDAVLVVFLMRNHYSWLQATDLGTQPPQTKRTHSINDAVAIPGIFQFKGTLGVNDLDPEWKYKYSGQKESRITLKSNGNIELDTDEQVNITGSAKVYIQSGDITLDAPTVTCTNNLTVNGTIRAEDDISTGGDVTTDAGVSLNTHPHGDVQPGSGVSGPPAV